VSLRYSTWVANLVPIEKKNGDIRLCVDSRNSNEASLRENYPLPNMDRMLQEVTGSEMPYMLDGSPGYNQVLVVEDNKAETAFTTSWGTFAYIGMPFGSMNADATFHRAMLDFAFRGTKD